MRFKSKRFCRLVCVATVAAATASAQAIIPLTSSGNVGAAPIGVAVNASELLFTQPYEPAAQIRGVYKVTIASPTTSSTSALVYGLPDGTASENYLAISPGLDGFTAGDTYATGQSLVNPANEAVYKNGALFIDGLPASFHHAGVTFDTAGTFGFNLIVTLEGTVRGYNSAGVLQFSYPTPSAYVFEGATVAPLTYGACPGCLYITGELVSNVTSTSPTGFGAIFLVKPNTPSGSMITFVTNTPGPEPEGLVFVESNRCSLDGYNYFVSGYANTSDKGVLKPTTGDILAYTPTQLSSYVGQFLVPNEGLPGSGVISAYNGTTFSTFSSTTYQLEASTIVQCAPATGCPATQGFWHKAANWPTASDVVDGVVYSGAPNYTMTIGGITYTQSQLLSLMPTGDLHPGDFANSLSQFIAAVLNVAAGAQLTLSGADAIAAVNTALTGVNIFCPTGTSDSICSAIPPSVIATVESYEPALDNYNSAVGLGCTEGAGLNTGSGK